MTRLRKVFGATGPHLESQPIVIVKKGEEKIGLAVDELLGTQEIVIKPVHRYVRDNRHFSGSAIIGSGEVVMVLDVGSLVMSKRLVLT